MDMTRLPLIVPSRLLHATAMVAVLGALVLAAPAPARAQLAEDVSLGAAMQAFNFGDNQLAGRYFWKLAAGGDPQAQYYLAYMLDAGLGMGRDLYQAARWYQKSAEQDFLPAVVYMGYIYSIGHGVTRDEKQAFAWYTRAAQMGDAIAQNNLATMLRTGKPYRKDLKLALQWFQQAAAQGNARAQYNLATMYRRGEGVKKSPQDAIKWYTFAANQGDMYAQSALGGMYRLGDGIDKDYLRSLDWYRRAAEQGHRGSQFALARMYDSGEVEGAGPSEAAIWYYHAAAQGHDKAQHRLGYMYEIGMGLPKDTKEALRWYTKAANDHGNTMSMLAMASMYDRGVIGKSATAAEQSLSWYKKAADLGDGNAQMELGRKYRDGIGVQRDKIESYKWYALAVENLPEGELRDQAIVERIDAINGLNASEADLARNQVAGWQRQTFRPPSDGDDSAVGAGGAFTPAGRDDALAYD